MEHLGDSVAGRYVLVAPARPREARRVYHAVDMVADRTVLVRFEPRYGDSHHGGSPLKTADGHRVIDGGTFGGEAYVVVDAPGPGRTVRLDLPVTELEAMYAAPAAERARPGRRADRHQRLRRHRRHFGLAAHVAGALSIVVLLVAAAVLATRTADPPAGPTSRAVVGGSAPGARPGGVAAPGAVPAVAAEAPGAAPGPVTNP